MAQRPQRTYVPGNSRETPYSGCFVSCDGACAGGVGDDDDSVVLYSELGISPVGVWVVNPVTADRDNRRVDKIIDFIVTY